MKKILVILFLLSASFAYSKASDVLWLRYPSISPDGNKIAFSYQGDIFVVNSNGGKATQLTRHTAHDTHPIWTPDGKSIIFASDRHGNFDIHIMDAEGGSAERLTFYSGNEIPESVTPDGKNVLFTAVIQDAKESVMFPNHSLPELYQVSVKGGRIEQVLTSPAENAVWNKNQTVLYYHDKKGYEDKWRKHHKSSVTRDVWKYTPADNKHTRLTNFRGEDRNPVSASDGRIYFLSEQFGTFNVCCFLENNPSEVKQVSKFSKYPVRFLSIADNNKLCYSYGGEIYTQLPNKKAKKVNIDLRLGRTKNDIQHLQYAGGISDMAVSPNGKEIAFVSRGEVFVTSVKYNTTKRITNTPEQERSVSFSPKGDAVLYAGERNGSWNLYQTKLVNKDEKYFSNASLLEEEVLLETTEDTFQPRYSPNGKEVAFLAGRTELRVLNLKSEKVRIIMPKDKNYSYSDGDQWYEWSPDSKWFLVKYLDKNIWISEVGLVSAKGNKPIINLTQSGYNDSNPRWMMNGKMILWQSDRSGYRSHGSWGSEYDAYAMFLTQDSYDKFRLSKEEYEMTQEDKKPKEKKKEKKEEKKKKKKEEKGKLPKVKNIKIDLKGIRDRIVRLTINSSFLSDAVVTPSGKKMYYLSKFEKGYDLWSKDLRTNTTKLVSKMSGIGGGFEMDKSGKNLFFISGGQLKKMVIASQKISTVSYRMPFELDAAKEREYIFNHAWRQVKYKFYDPKIHGLDWDEMKNDYSKFLPYINNNYDFSDLLGELLGELNASHTGARYYYRSIGGDITASLGIIIDKSYKGAGLKIGEILDKGPFQKADIEVQVGDIITKIDGKDLVENKDFYHLLNRKVGKKTLIELSRPKSLKKDWTVYIKPISIGAERQLLYKRWVKRMKHQTDSLSGGRLGYIHVKGMNSSSYRNVYSQLLGIYGDKDAVIVDTRFNGGGWLHDDLVTLLSGKPYWKFMPRGQYIGTEPLFKWKKPSAVLVSEGNYSDAHGFPFAYKTLGIGKLVGMPIPGTCTAVWWERQIDPTLVFGIPQVGLKDKYGNYLENQQLEPDVKVRNEIERVTKGEDQQLKAAIKELLIEVNKNK